MSTSWQPKFWKTTLLHLFLPAATIVALFIYSTFFVTIPYIEQQLHQAQRQNVRELTTVALAMLQELHQQAVNGHTSDAQARQEAIRQLRTMRYGNDGKDYFWILDTAGTIIMHPYSPDHEGEALWEYFGQSQHKFFDDAHRVSATPLGGLVTYRWQYKDNTGKILYKESFVRRFEPWQWIIGTGFYPDDVNEQLSHITKRLTQGFLIVLTLLLAAATLMLRKALIAQRHSHRDQQALAESEGRFRSIMASMNDLVFICSPDYRLQYANPATLRYIEGSKDSIHCHTALFGLDKPCPWCNHQKVLSGQSQHDEIVNPRNGLTYAISSAPLEESSGVRADLVIMRDISALRKQEQQLRLSEQRLGYVLRATNDGYWDWHIPTNQVYFDNRYYTMAGYQPEDYPASFDEWKKRVHPDDLPRTLDTIDAHIAGESEHYVTQFRFQTKRGGWMWILGRGLIVERDSAGGVLRMVGTHTDISERVRTEMALRESEYNLSLTLDSIGEGVIATDTQGTITRINPAALQLTGWEIHKALGQPLGEVLQLKEAPDSAAQSLLEQDGAHPPCHILTARDGTERRIVHTTTSIRGAEGLSVGSVVIVRDITMQHRLEEELRQAQKMDSIGQLAGGIAHDFNNMLAGIMGYADMLSKALHNRPDLSQFARNIFIAADRSASLTSKLLTFSRKAPLRTQRIDLHAIIQETLALLQHSIDRRITITTTLATTTPQIIGDATQLQNALLNLCINARDAMPRGGTLTISTADHTVLDQNHVRGEFSLQPGPHVCVEVCDSGSGMDSATLQRIFEPFFTTKQPGCGTGLGLSAVYGTVREHSGSIEVSSTPGEGSQFRILLPAFTKAQPVARPAEPAPPPPTRTRAKKETILVIDDEQILREMAQLILKNMGYTVLIAKEGVEGVELFEQHAEQVDCIILDLVMPRLSGEETFKRLRQLKAQLPIIICSGYSSDMDIDEMLQNGPTVFLKKPYNQTELVTALRRQHIG